MTGNGDRPAEPQAEHEQAGQHQAEQHQAEQHQAEQHQAETHHAEPHHAGHHDEEKIRRAQQLPDGSGSATRPDSDKDVASGGPADPER